MTARHGHRGARAAPLRGHGGPRPGVRLTALLLLSGAACPSPPDRKLPPTVSTPITVGTHVLVPASTFMFDSPAEYWSTVAITDHPDACGELSALPACRPESWIWTRGYADSPPTVRTALEIGLGFSWTGTPEPFVGSPPGTYAVSPSCQFPFAGATVGGANAAFIAHDAAGRVVALDEAVGGTVVIEAMSSGRGSAGSYDLVLASGARISGDFAGQYCGEVAAHVQSPCCPEQWTYGSAEEDCACGGATARSSCAQPTAGGEWVCLCTNTDATQSTCTMPSGTRAPRGLCPHRYFTCCPMCP